MKDRTSIEKLSVDEFLNSEFFESNPNQLDVVLTEDWLESAAVRIKSIKTRSGEKQQKVGKRLGF